MKFRWKAPRSLANANNLRILIKVNKIRKLHLALNLMYLSFFLLTRNSCINKRRNLKCRSCKCFRHFPLNLGFGNFRKDYGKHYSALVGLWYHRHTVHDEILPKKATCELKECQVLHWKKHPMLCSFIEITLQHGCSSVKLLRIFRTPFLKNTSGWLLLLVYL